MIILTMRLVEQLKKLPRDIRSDFVFVNPATGKAWNDIRKMWNRARKAAGLQGAWFHDLRRSFVTNTRRRGMSGHRTRSVFNRYNIEEEDLRAAARRLEEGKARAWSKFGQSWGSRGVTAKSPAS